MYCKKNINLKNVISLSDLEKARKSLYSRETRRRNPYKDLFCPPIGRERNKFSKERIDIGDIYRQCNNFQFKPYRGIAIMKDEGAKRPLLVPETKDRIVLKAMFPKIIDIIAQKVSENDNIFGVGKKFSPKKVSHLITEIGSSIHQKEYKYLVKVDFSNFFSTIDRKMLLELLKRKYFNMENKHEKIIFNFIKASIYNEIADIDGNFFCGNIKKLNLRENGIPQGLPYSPILASIYTMELDNFIKESDGSIFIRYIDDLLVLSKTKKYRDELFAGFQNLAKKKKLKINCKKTAMVNFTKPNAQITFLGVNMLNNGILQLPNERREKIHKKLETLKSGSAILNKYIQEPYYKQSSYYEVNENGPIINKKIRDSICGIEQYFNLLNLHRKSEFINELKDNFL